MDTLPSNAVPTGDIGPYEQTLLDERTIAETNKG